ncbi:MAG: DegT/DnrJ/EryC1/StrS family aminotransferase [Thermodesulfobacteriota bacterium]
MKVDFYRHSLEESDIERVTEVLRSTFLTTGEVTAAFEKKLAAYLGVKHVVGVMSCTQALHLSLLAWGIGPGDEVITTPMTFIASSNAVLHAGATPVFVDVEKRTGNLDAGRIEEKITPRTRAILPVHLYGQMSDMKEIRWIADRRGLIVIEDAAHCLEGERDGVRPGRLGEAACLSFYATKNITSGEGGAIATNDDRKADLLRRLRLHGMDKSAADRYTKLYRHWDMSVLGWKANLDNIKAALLIGQLDRVEDRWRRREEIARRYRDAFSRAPGLGLMSDLPGVKHARHLFTVHAPPDRRDAFLAGLQERGVGVAVNYRAVHLLDYYARQFGFRRGDYPVAEAIGDATVTLPLYPGLKDEEIEYVIEAVSSEAESWSSRC